MQVRLPDSSVHTDTESWFQNVVWNPDFVFPTDPAERLQLLIQAKLVRTELETEYKQISKSPAGHVISFIGHLSGYVGMAALIATPALWASILTDPLVALGAVGSVAVVYSSVKDYKARQRRRWILERLRDIRAFIDRLPA